MRTLLALPILLAACGGVSTRDLRVAEDRRERQSATLLQSLESPDVALRTRAAVACGRIQDPGYVAPLCARLQAEKDNTVVRELLFALGQMAFSEDLPADVSAIEAAIGAWRKDSDPATRQVAVEALGKIGGPNAAAWITEALRDPTADVRGEAAIALFRLRFVPVWTKRAEKPPDLPESAVNALVDAANDTNDEVRWRVAYALSRYGQPDALVALRKLAADPNVWARLFAVRALGRSGNAEVRDSIRVALHDPDALVRTEAVTAAERLKLWSLYGPAMLEDPSLHVRAALAAALADGESGHADLLAKLATDASLTVRCAAVASRGRRGEDVKSALSDPHWKMRKTAAAFAPVEALDDSDRRVRAAAVEAMGALADEKTASLLLRALGDADLGIRIAAVGALAKRKDLPKLEPLRQVYEKSMKREDVEVREEIADAAAGLPEATEFLKILLKDPAQSVRTKARRELVKRKESVPPAEPPEIEPTPLLDRTFTRPPVVVLETERGTIEIECYSTEAQVHTASFVELARKGVYDGLIFHRVVSNFVIQGGDPRGDGSGDAGYHLRDEINRMRYARGTVGMPKAGKDTGGCQIFITHTPTPHLDGNYTVFGRVVTGLEVVDRIEEGDRILKARVR